MFSDITPPGKCGNPACFESKQGDFLTANWSQSKIAEKFGTRGFCFGHKLPQEHRQVLFVETADRCRDCDQFISVLRTTGVVVSGYDRTCIGPRVCFDELYNKKPEPPATETEQESPETQPGHPVTEPAKPVTTSSESKKEPAKPVTKPSSSSSQSTVSGPVFSAFRGEKHLEVFFKSALPAKVYEAGPGSPQALRLTLLSLALASTAAKTLLIAEMGLLNNVKPELLAEKIFEIPHAELLTTVRNAALAHIMDPQVPANVRRFVAGQFDIDLAKEWALTKEYLSDLNKGEIISVCEEEGVGIWKDDKIKASRQKKHKGKGLHALTKDQLIDLILNSGADLPGRVPAEILGKGK